MGEQYFCFVFCAFNIQASNPFARLIAQFSLLMDISPLLQKNFNNSFFGKMQILAKTLTSGGSQGVWKVESWVWSQGGAMCHITAKMAAAVTG